MIRRVLTFLVVAVIAAAATAVVSSAQTAPRASASVPGAEIAKAFVAARTAKNWVPPKTPWGDPDLQGNFTNKDEANTPYERPKVFEGRRMEDITPQELAAEIIVRQKGVAEEAAIVDQGPPSHFRDSMNATNSRPWFVIDPPEGKIPPMTAEAQTHVKPRAPRYVRADSYEDLGLSDRCIANRIPPSAMQPGIYGNSYQILQTPDYVAIRNEMGPTRLIPLDGRPQANPSMHSYVGDARGRWEGNTLLVETTNFNEKIDYRGVSIKTLHLIERFTRIAPKTVEWTVTLDDQATWTRPWTFSVPLTEDDTQLILEYACHEGNYGLANILSASRAVEKRVTEAGKTGKP